MFTDLGGRARRWRRLFPAGGAAKLLHVVDGFTCEVPTIECRRWIDADAAVAVLDRLVAACGPAPE